MPGTALMESQRQAQPREETSLADAVEASARIGYSARHERR